LRSICLPASVEFLGEGAFSSCRSLSAFTFESGSKLTRIEAFALLDCYVLKSICLPASVEFLGVSSYSSCWSLSSLTFESGSRLTLIPANTVNGCSSLQSRCLPASIEILGNSSLSNCYRLSSLTFESGSKLTRIEEDAFDGCSLLKFLLIPRSVNELRRNWAHRSSLRLVAFESGVSLRIMLETCKADLSCIANIGFIECDCTLNFPGYYVQLARRVNYLRRLKKK
jgi:hypothetical protein